MQIAKPHRYVSASGPLAWQAALAVAENEGWRILPVPVPVPAAGKPRTARLPNARGPKAHAREYGYGGHG